LGTSHNAALVGRILDRIEERCADVARSMAEAMRDEVAAYRGIRDPRMAAEIIAHAEDHVRAFVRSARSGRPPRGAELDFVRERGVKRARELLPLDALLEAYLIGQRVTWEAIVAEAGRTPDGLRAAQALTRTTFAYTHAINVAVADAYVRTRQHAAAEADRVKRDLLDTLLSGRVPAGAEQLESHGLQLEARQVVVVARLDRGHGLRLAADAVAQAAGSGAFVVPRHGEVVAVLPVHVRRGPRDLAGALTRAAADVLRTRGTALRAGVSTVCADLGEVARGYGEAQQALRHATGTRPAVALEELSVTEYLSTGTDHTVRRLVPAATRRLVEDDGALVETIRAYAGCDLNVARTAQRLMLHANTVHYRLRRIEELSGLDPRRFSDLMELVTAIRLVDAERR
jgi:hypothetical protein